MNVRTKFRFTDNDQSIEHHTSGSKSQMDSRFNEATTATDLTKTDGFKNVASKTDGFKTFQSRHTSFEIP